MSRSASSVNFNFERTNLSRNVFGLRKATRGGLGKTAFSKSVFCTCRCALFDTSKTICNAVRKVNTRLILSSWCFGRFLRRLFLSIKFTFWISRRMISDFYLLSVNHDSKSNNFRCKSLSFEEIRFIWIAWSYGADFLQTDLWHDVACKYWCVSVDFVNKLVSKLLSLSSFNINTS